MSNKVSWTFRGEKFYVEFVNGAWESQAMGMRFKTLGEVVRAEVVGYLKEQDEDVASYKNTIEGVVKEVLASRSGNLYHHFK